MKNIKICIYVLTLFGMLFSQSISDFQEAQKRYEEYKKGNLELGIQQILPDTNIVNQLAEFDTLFQYMEDEKLPKHNRYFGYDYFTLRDSIRIWPNVSAPDNYILGPGDKVEISIWGRAQLNNSYTINRDGDIYDERIGLVSLEGKSLKEARIVLFNKFSEKISSLKGKSPTSFINVTLGKLKSINVHFVGHVKYPGIHLVHPLSDLMTGLLQAGGVDTTGTLRNIQLKRNGELFKEIDLYDFLISGNSSESILLQNNDIIIVPTRISSVTITGNVYDPAIFEAHFDETLNDILSFSGGLKPNTSDKFILKRITPLDERKKELISYQKDLLLNYNDLKNEYIKDGDLLTVYSLPLTENFITISGQVKEPGEYPLTDSLTLKDILIQSGGIEDNDFLRSVNTDQIEIIRIDNESYGNSIIKIKLQDLYDADQYNEIFLEKDDHIVVHRNVYYTHENVIVEGEIIRPGVYSIDKSDKSLEKIIISAGGLTQNAFKEGINVFRDSSKLIWDDFSVTLSDGDSIYVPQKPYAVFVTGEVYNPGYIHYRSGKSVGKYIESAGGYKPTGNKRDVLVVGPNGDVKTNKLFPRKVADGSTIIVNIKPKKDPVDYGSIIRQTVSLATSLALTYVAIQGIK